jgi:protein SCO1/2
MNRLSRQRKVALAVCLGLLLLMLGSLGGLAAVDYRLTHTQTAEIGGPFSLTEDTGQAVSDKDFRGKYVLIYFGYTSCPDVCPLTLADLTAALKKLGAKADEVQPLFVTVDPTRDTSAVLKSYTAAFSPRLIGLTGSQQQLAAVEKEFKVYTKIRRNGDDPNDYSIDHSSAFYLLGPDGRFIAALNADEQGDQLASDLSHYL